MSNYHHHISQKNTPQNQPIPGREAEMVKNLAGGYAFPVTRWTRLNRFLILGSEGGTYYIGERALTIENANAIAECLKEDARRTIDTIVEVSDSGRAAKNEPALFALAMASAPRFVPEAAHRSYALDRLNEVARIGTHLFQFVEYMNELRGWGKAARRAIGNWYNQKEPGRLAYLMAKYQQRVGWSHQDVLRQAHPVPATPAHNALYAWAKTSELEPEHDSLRIIEGMQKAHAAESVQEVINLINDYRLTREMVPTQWFDSPEVWEAMLQGMPLHATIRNLGKMSNVGLLKPLSDAAKLVAERLTDQEYIRSSRLHPWSILVALHQYGEGHGARGSLEWTPVTAVTDALDAAFMLAFDNVIPIGKRVLIGIDISGSMGSPYGPAVITTGIDRRGRPIHGMAAAQAAAAMALVTARTEPNYEIALFNTQAQVARMSANSNLKQVTANIFNAIVGGTDYSAPIRLAMRERFPVDCFIIYGDEQSWSGGVHACQAIRQYRQLMGIPAKLAVVNFCSTDTTVLDPNDNGTAGFVGMDTSTPRLVADYMRDEDK